MEAVKTERLDFETFRPKLGLWADKFKPFIEGKEMWDIMQKIKADAWNSDGTPKETIVPLPKDTFKAFATTNPADLKVVFYLMDPYPRKYKNGEFQATGIAMDCSNTPDGKLQPSLELFYDAMETEMNRVRTAHDKDVNINRCKSLEYLHEQGVMLLNTDLTCKLNKTGSHEKLWEPFQEYFLDEILRSDTGIVYVLCGKASHRMARYINPYCTIYKLSHPASAAYSGTPWDSEDVFTKVNRKLYEHFGRGSEVYWNKDDWDAYKEPPF